MSRKFEFGRGEGSSGECSTLAKQEANLSHHKILADSSSAHHLPIMLRAHAEPGHRARACGRSVAQADKWHAHLAWAPSRSARWSPSRFWARALTASWPVANHCPGLSSNNIQAAGSRPLSSSSGRRLPRSSSCLTCTPRRYARQHRACLNVGFEGQVRPRF